MKIKLKIRRNLKVPIIILIVTLILQVSLGMIALVKGDSMSPFIRNHAIIFSTLNFQPQLGDIIVVKIKDKKILKRVVGTPGDILEYNPETKALRINGKEENEIAYGLYDVDFNDSFLTKEGDQPYFFNEDNTWLKLKDKEYFVMGDNRENSFDSRYFGPVPSYAIKAKVLKFINLGR